jgi:hypothetical protein
MIKEELAAELFLGVVVIRLSHVSDVNVVLDVLLKVDWDGVHLDVVVKEEFCKAHISSLRDSTGS